MPEPGSGASGLRPYRLYGHTVLSEIPLAVTVAPLAAEDLPILAIRQSTRNPASARKLQTAYEWRRPGSPAVCRLLTDGDMACLEYPGQVSFCFPGDGQVVVFSHGNLPVSTLRHLLVRQVVPRYLGETGTFALHASAVDWPGHGAVLFTGDSGFGKTTIANGLASRLAEHLSRPPGAGVLAEDGVVLQTVVGDTMAWGPESPPRPLRAVFALNDPSEPASATSVAPMGGGEALVSILHGGFLLDPSKMDNTVSGFRAVAGILRPPVRVYSLAYPRTFASLDEVFRQLCDIVSVVVR